MTAIAYRVPLVRALMQRLAVVGVLRELVFRVGAKSGGVDHLARGRVARRTQFARIRISQRKPLDHLGDRDDSRDHSLRIGPVTECALGVIPLRGPFAG